MRDSPQLINIHAFAKLTVTRKSLNILQRRESFLHPLNRLYQRLSRLAQSDMHAVLCVCCRPKEAYIMSLARDPQTQIPNLHQQLCVLKLFKSWATESVACLGQRTLNDVPGAADPKKVMSSCRPILVISREPARPSWRGQTPARTQT